MSIGTLKPSMTIIYNGALYTVVNCEHAKIARGAAFCRVKLKNLRNAQILDCTLRDSDNVNQAFIEKRKLQYQYREGTHYHFLDLETYEDLILNESIIRENSCWLKDNLELIGIFFENELVDLELPASIELKIIETNPGFRGDTVKAGNKPAKLETGIVISVPLFINTGETVKVDTRTKTYLGRV
ncbi:MAG: elongation factor P [Candidatus Omnitrophica bacterium]|nr:elongation factor P [Candidatus Omnitrophota bacterium]MDD5429747.1 elongation factor P [Candidatus Omnitrophota bacterium]